ncbi:hypothetical protein HHK36_012493 [Tetracentron sinense]|uniref:Adenylyl cyclase n=1 Tax=Tetracentron sinense TaxID=13715 RepID=A0A835DFR5_TETSI|nr:hypothetical protein HHK36_012493 [Tetracentron sinense]
MQVTSNARRLSRVLRSPIFLHSERFLAYGVEKLEDSFSSCQWRNQRSFSVHISKISGTVHGICFPLTARASHLGHHPMCSMVARAYFSSEATTIGEVPTEVVKDLYDKMLKSVEAQTMPPNAWSWSLIENCANREDINLLFQILQNLRRFRLSNLRIHSNFNSNLCRSVTEACARVGAIDFGKKALWKHNVYGLTPSIGSAHYLLFYAKKHNDAKLMVEIMKLLKKNDLPLQPGTADIVFSICFNTDNWQLISKYSKKFIKAGVKLRRTTFDIWMEFAAKIGDTESIWQIEKLRSNLMKQHTLASGISCAKGFLLEHKPESAAAIIQVLNQNLPDAKRPGIAIELQKLVSEWPSEVIKHQQKDKKALACSLKSDIAAMVSGLSNMGLEVSANLEALTRQEAIPC